MKIANYSLGEGQPLTLIAGPCQIETPELCHTVASHLKTLCAARGINYVFKASFDKANRTSIHSARGLGMEKGLAVLDEIKCTYELPVTTDVHESYQCAEVAKVCAVLQIPAYLCRQTDLLVAAGSEAKANGGAVNVKKGQFLAPEDTRHVAQKVRDAGCENVMLTERGTTFGYNNLVVDFRGLPIMRAYAPVCFDATHAVQKPGGGDGVTLGDRRFVPPLARAAMAVGIDALFLETHPDPDKSLSDGPNMVKLDDMEALLDELLAVRAAVAG